MSKRAGPYTSDATAMAALARAIDRVAQTDGDHTTAIPALTLHRRKAPTEPLHCIYNLGLGVVAQGDKQVFDVCLPGPCKPLKTNLIERTVAEFGSVCDNLYRTARKLLILKRRDVRVVEGARLEIDSACAC